MRVKRKLTSVVRRSVALPRRLVEDAVKFASPELRNNMNRLVIVALEEYILRRQEQRFEEAMAQMARDPAINLESQAITQEFETTDLDGLKGL